MYNERSYTTGEKQMTWNIFKRIAALEKVTIDLHQALSMLHNQMRVKYPPLEADKEKEKKRLYHREWRAKNKLSEDAREKKNAYARAYYARKKGETK
jgi:hypothetical protein